MYRFMFYRFVALFITILSLSNAAFAFEACSDSVKTKTATCSVSSSDSTEAQITASTFDHQHSDNCGHPQKSESHHDCHMTHCCAYIVYSVSNGISSLVVQSSVRVLITPLVGASLSSIQKPPKA